MNIELEDKPDAALVWHLENREEIEQAGIIKFDAEKEQAVKHPKKAVGENSYEEFFITGEKEGSQVLTFFLRQPWIKTGGKELSLTVEVVA